ncbi:MAG: hypothetical protein AVO39_08570 [delta proteobacterium MLS_D]|jgi:uncharacterized protein YbgA (DUF1722 family)/uncharacterized protein YbbK (DUF523 family)|nr:MAG: hypothetical protein AVO39_08570 [delta proteobacterium MLS_D]
MDKIRLGISSCLLGEAVRYDGGHKLDRFLRDTLGKYVEYVSVCPEVECGMGVPRESMRLEGDPARPRLVTVRTKEDKTDIMVRWARKRLDELAGERLLGFIFKSGSPSSGMERVRVYNEKGVPGKNGTGLFAGMFMKRFPRLPVEEEGRLHDVGLRENFIERIFALQRWRETANATPGIGALVAFHSRHKLLFMSHSPKHYRESGKLVADGKKYDAGDLYERYETLLVEALELKATVKKHVNVLQHMMGYFKRQLSGDEKKELLEVIENYSQGHVPLVVPLTLVRHYVRKYDEPYLKEQVYLEPHPLELQLRNHA